MPRIRVLVVLLLALSGVFCEVYQDEAKKGAEKTGHLKKTEKKNEKRDSSELTAAIYGFKQRDEPFQSLYQYHYQGTPLRAISTQYVTAANTPQLSYSKPEGDIGVGEGPSVSPIEHKNDGDGGTATATGNTGIQYAHPNSYKPKSGVHYTSGGAFKSISNSDGGIPYAPSTYRGSFIAAYHPTSAEQVKENPAAIYGQAPSSTHPPSVTLPLYYGGFEQMLPQQHRQQNQYAIAFPADYVRHYQQNLAAPFPLHGAHMVPIIYTASPAALPGLKNQPFKQSAVQIISLPQPVSSASTDLSSSTQGPSIITHFIPFYGMGIQNYQQAQRQSSLPFYLDNHQQAPSTFALTTSSPMQQSIQIPSKHQLFNPIQMANIRAAVPIPIIPYSYKPTVAVQHQQQQQQQIHQQRIQRFYQQYVPSATSYTRYSESLSGGRSGGPDNSVKVSDSDLTKSSTLRLGPLYSTSSSTNSGNIYSDAMEGSGRSIYKYAPTANSVVPVYSHPGAIHYGTHLYHPPTKVVEIGSNRVTAGSGIIAGEASPISYPQQQSGAANSHRGSSSSSVV